VSLLDLPAQVADLTARLQALEQAQPAPAPDQLTPNVFTINPDGTISEKLTGKLEALGIVFSEGEKEGAPVNSILWQLEGAARQSISGYKPAGKGPGPDSVLALRAVDPGGVSLVELSAEDGNNEINLRAGGQLRRLLSSSGESSFLQLPEFGVAELVFGISQVEWTAKGFDSAYTTIVTPFATPAAWVGFPITGLGNAEMGSGGSEASQVKFTMRTQIETAAGTKAFFSYFIVGH
jgi:hypothetical protein